MTASCSGLPAACVVVPALPLLVAPVGVTAGIPAAGAWAPAGTTPVMPTAPQDPVAHPPAWHEEPFPHLPFKHPVAHSAPPHGNLSASVSFIHAGRYFLFGNTSRCP